MTRLWKLLPAVVSLYWLAGSVGLAQEPSPESGAPTETPRKVLQIDSDGGVGLSLQLEPTLSVVTGDGLRLSNLTVGSPFGVDVSALDPALRAQLDIADDQGVVVTAVADGSDAAKAGVQQHDIVLRIGEQPVASSERFNELISAEQGKGAVFHLMRRGQPQTIEVNLPSVPQYELALTDQLLTVWDTSQSLQHYRIGVTLDEADDTLRSQLRLAAGEGLVVTEVIGDGPAATAGIKPHDVLVKLDGKRLSTVDNINAQIQEIGEKPVALDYIRAGQEQTCEVTPLLSQGATYQTVSGLLGDAVTAQRNVLWSVRGNGQTGALVQWFRAADGINQPDAESTAQTDAAAQIEEIQRQLREISKVVGSLGATLQAPSTGEQPGDGQPAEREDEPPKPEE
jgi:membrane-associated protease RseP (regulator of RpoE activity)